MLIRSKRKLRHPDAPMRHEHHARPMTRRELLGQGFLAGSATVWGGGIMSLFANPRAAWADLAGDLDPLGCGITNGAGKIPFICFDLAGGANISGSNALVGQNGQLDTLSTAGYSKLGLPGDQIPGVAETAPTGTSNGDHTDTSLGLAFHSDSAFLRGMQASFKTPGLAANVNGAIIPARSDNDTGNNPHNPMYGIQRAGADGSILTLAGSRNSESGGNSMAPAMLINPQFRPTKVDRPSDVTGLVDTGELLALLSQDDAVAVMESINRLSEQKMGRVSTGLTGLDPNNPGLTRDEVIEDLVGCGYLSAAGCGRQIWYSVRLGSSTGPPDCRRSRHLQRRGVQWRRTRRQRVPEDRVGHENGRRRLRRRGLYHHGWVTTTTVARARKASRKTSGPGAAWGPVSSTQHGLEGAPASR